MEYIGIQQYKIAVTGTASTAQIISLEGLSLRDGLQARIFTKGTDMTFKFGGSSVVADATATSNKLVARNVTQASGNTELYALSEGMTHVSVISEDETSTGTFHMTIGVIGGI